MTQPLAKVIADTVSPAGVRITTIEARMWKPLLAELNTHRALSRSAASSRAIPLEKVRKQVIDDPYIPVEWGRNRSGMKATDMLDSIGESLALIHWQNALSNAITQHVAMEHTGVHKQIANRLLEPWLTVPVLVTATEWKNFFALRCHPDAQPDLRVVAGAMRDAMEASTPVEDIFHVPYIKEGEPKDCETTWRCCSARCARTSYRLMDGRETTREKDLGLAGGLQTDGHWSPFEHVAFASPTRTERNANLIGWQSLRNTLGDTAHGDYRT